MPLNTRDIRRRIKSVQSTKKITKAMEMVAAAKVRRAKGRVLANRPYAEKLAEIFAHVTANLPPGEVWHPLLRQREPTRSLILLLTSDKGFCGGYNSNVIRFGLERMRENREAGIQSRFLVVGTKGVNFFRHANLPVVARIQGLSAIPTPLEAETLVTEAITHFQSGDVDRVELIYTRFGGMTKFLPLQVNLLPASLEALKGEGLVDTTLDLDDRKETVLPVAKLDVGTPYLFEPDAEQIIGRLIPTYLANEVYQALLEAAASELASRMMAMAAASKSAGELISHLTIVYNKARQAGITQELLEIVGGAEALKG